MIFSNIFYWIISSVGMDKNGGKEINSFYVYAESLYGTCS